MKYQVHIRSQHAKRRRGGFSGPDTYVAVTGTPEGVEMPYVLNQATLMKLGIEIFYFGVGYNQHTGPKSALGKATAAAEKFASEKNAVEESPKSLRNRLTI
jgi:hypothetical protein